MAASKGANHVTNSKIVFWYSAISQHEHTIASESLSTTTCCLLWLSTFGVNLSSSRVTLTFAKGCQCSLSIEAFTETATLEVGGQQEGLACMRNLYIYIYMIFIYIYMYTYIYIYVVEKRIWISTQIAPLKQPSNLSSLLASTQEPGMRCWNMLQVAAWRWLRGKCTLRPQQVHGAPGDETSQSGVQWEKMMTWDLEVHYSLSTRTERLGSNFRTKGSRIQRVSLTPCAQISVPHAKRTTRGTRGWLTGEGQCC